MRMSASFNDVSLLCLRRAFGRAIRVAEATGPVPVINSPNPSNNAVVVNMHISKVELKEMKKELKLPAAATADGDGAGASGADAKAAKGKVKGKGSAAAADKAAADAAALLEDAAREKKREEKKKAREQEKRDAAESLALAQWQTARGGPHTKDPEFFSCKNTTTSFVRGAFVFHSSLCAFSAR